MKKSIIMLALCFLAMTVKAQLSGRTFTIPATLVMPDGSVVPRRSMDSIRKVFGGREVTFSLLEDGTAHVHPASTKTEALESEAKLNAHVDKPAPGFTFKSLDGKLYSLPALKGKIIVLNFWYTQCGGCIAEIPDLNKLKQDYNSNDVVFLALTFDDNAKVKAFLTKHKFNYTLIPNANKACLDYDIPDYPVSIVIDQNGIVKYINNGIGSNIKSELTKAIEGIKDSTYKHS